MVVDAVIAEGAVKAFDEGVLHGFAGLECRPGGTVFHWWLRPVLRAGPGLSALRFVAAPSKGSGSICLF